VHAVLTRVSLHIDFACDDDRDLIRFPYIVASIAYNSRSTRWLAHNIALQNGREFTV
jgi:hypothetical protein